MNFKSLDLNLLRVLDALLETGSTTKAGQRIGLSQPAVSAALGRLRHSLGDPLFVIQGRKLVPTDYAAALAGPLRDVLSNTEALLAGPKNFDPANSHDTFRVSGSDFYAELLVAKLAIRLQTQAPNMSVHIFTPVSDNPTEALEREELHLGVVPRSDFPD